MADLTVQGLSLPEMVNPANYISGDAITKFFLNLQIFIVVALVGWAVWYFRFHRRSWSDVVHIWDITGSGIRVYADRGKWLKDKNDGTGFYSLWYDKKARPKQPLQQHALITAKGKTLYRFLKFGNGPFDYAQLSQSLDEIDINFKEKVNVMALSDIDWGKHEVKKEIEKKNLGKFWETYKGPIILAGMFIFAILAMMWLVGFANDSLQAVISESSSARADNKEIASALNRVANSNIDLVNELRGTKQPDIPLNEITNPPL